MESSWGERRLAKKMIRSRSSSGRGGGGFTRAEKSCEGLVIALVSSSSLRRLLCCDGQKDKVSIYGDEDALVLHHHVEVCEPTRLLLLSFSHSSCSASSFFSHQSPHLTSNEHQHKSTSKTPHQTLSTRPADPIRMRLQSEKR